MWRVYLQVDGLTVDALVVSRYSCRFVLDFALHVLEVFKPSIGNVVKLCPFWLCSNTQRRMWYMNFVSLIVAGDVDQLQDEWPPCDDTAASWKKIAAHYVLQY